MGAHHVQTVTDKEGRFRLPKLPDGDYELLAIHELLGRATARFEIKAGDPEPIEITFKVPEKFRSDGFPSPSARWAHAMAYDPLRQRTVLHGGWATHEGKSSCLGDLWEWDGSRWWEINADTGPRSSARADHTMAFDRERGSLVVLAGRAEGGRVPWDWGESKDKKWKQMPSFSLFGPPGRWDAAMVYDPARKLTVLFGGHAGPWELRDTWEWNGQTWTQRN